MAEPEKRPSANPGGGDHEGVNVQVLLRCRPLSDREIVDRQPQVITCSDALREVTLFSNTGGKQSSRSFRFDRVFGPDSTQEKLFKQAIVPIVEEVLDGFNCTIFAYGQTGTGKTYTMEGGPRQSADGRKLSPEAGVIPRSIKQIFDTIEANQTDSTVKVSFLELYNEELSDLLATESADDKEKKLRLLEDRSGVVAHGLEEVIVKSAVEIYQVLDRGTAKRRTAETQLNKRSSRSHSVFTITIHMREATPEGEDVIKIGKLNLVDLAGSENISRSGAKDARAREAGSINQSLLTLGRVITALVEHNGHVPYRDSKLTRLLRDSLGGRTKTCIIATIAPTVQCQEETISTLDYAHRAKNIRNRPEVNQKISKTTMIKEMGTEIERLKADLVATREKNGVYISTERYEQGELERAQLKETVKAMRAELEADEASHQAELASVRATAEREVEVLQEALAGREQELAGREQELADAVDRLAEAQAMVQERRFVSQAHERAEVALAAHAEGLTAELHACAGDLGALFERLEEAVRLQGLDRAVMAQVKDEVTSRLQRLGSTVTSAMAGQNQHMAGINRKLSDFAARKERDLALLQGQLAAIHTSVAALQAAVSGQLATGLATVTDAFEATRLASAAHAAGAAAADEAARATVDAAVRALSAGVEAQAGQLRAFAARQAAEADAAVGAVQGLVATVSEGLAGVRRSAAEVCQSAAQRQVAAEAALSGLTTTWQAETAQQQGLLMEQVTRMVAQFSAGRGAALAAAVGGLREHLAAGSKQLEGEVGALAVSTSALWDRVEASGAAACSQVSSSSAGLSGAVGTAASALGSCGEDIAGLGAILGRECDERGAARAAHVQAMSGHVRAGAAAAAQVADSTVAELEVQAKALAGVHDTLHSAAAAQHGGDEAAVADLLRSTAAASTSLSDFERCHAQEVAELGGGVREGVARQLGVPPASAPSERRAVALPPPDAAEELRCPPEDVILQQYRLERSQIVRRAGDLGGVSLVATASPLITRDDENIPTSPLSGSSNVTQRRGQQQPPQPSRFVLEDAAAAKGGVRSRIPGAPPVGARTANGLMDRTNL